MQNDCLKSANKFCYIKKILSANVCIKLKLKRALQTIGQSFLVKMYWNSPTAIRFAFMTKSEKELFLLKQSILAIVCMFLPKTTVSLFQYKKKKKKKLQ